MSDSSVSGRRGVTLTQHLTHQQKLARATGEFSTILAQISLAGKVIARGLSQAGLFTEGGYAGTTNVHGEAQKTLDVLCNEAFVKVFRHSPSVAAMVSEEMEEPVVFHTRWQGGKYIVCVDPLDGSSNLDVNGVVGSIFSVLRRTDPGESITP